MPKNIVSDDPFEEEKSEGKSDRFKKVVKKVENEKKSRHGKTDMEAVKRIMSQISSGSQWFKANVGRNEIRVLPSNREDGLPFFSSILHHGFRDETGGKRAYPCLGAAFKKPCPVCKVITFYENDGDSDVDSIITTLAPKRTYLMNIIDVTGGDVVKIYSATPSVAKKIIGAFSEEDYGDITDPEKGFNLIVKREGTGKTDTRYDVLFRRESSVINIEDWKTQMYDLEKEAYREIPSYEKYCEYLQDTFGGVLPDIEKATKLKTFKKGTDLDQEEGE